MDVEYRFCNKCNKVRHIVHFRNNCRMCRTCKAEQQHLRRRSKTVCEAELQYMLKWCETNQCTQPELLSEIHAQTLKRSLVKKLLKSKTKKSTQP